MGGQGRHLTRLTEAGAYPLEPGQVGFDLAVEVDDADAGKRSGHAAHRPSNRAIPGPF